MSTDPAANERERAGPEAQGDDANPGQATLDEWGAAAHQEDPLLDCLVHLTRYHGTPRSPSALKVGLPDTSDTLTPTMFLRAAARAGLRAQVLKRRFDQVTKDVLPIVVPLKDGQSCVVQNFDRDKGVVTAMLPERGGQVTTLPASEITERWSGYVIYAQPEKTVTYTRPEAESRRPSSWFWGTLRQSWWLYAQVVLAAVFINLFALVSPLFVMTVYDRVIPNNAQETLWVLATGVVTVIVFDLILKTLRAAFIDSAGRKADVLMASRLFDQVLDMKLTARPKSAGVFANTLREFESLRDFFTSITLAAMIDLPFVALFLFVIWLVSGPVALVLIAAVPIVLAYGLILQFPLRAVVRKNLEEASLKHGVLVETINGLETIKAVGAEGRMRDQWERAVGASALTAQRSRAISSSGVQVTSAIQQLVTVGIMLYGVHLIGENELSMGGLIACVMLGGRALAPLAQVAQLITRLNQSMASLKNLNEVMNAPVERAADKSYINRLELGGDIEFRNVHFRYPDTQHDVLNGVSFHIQAGESVAVIGRIGSGKSTVAKLLLGLFEATEGLVLIDGVDVRQIDPADLRRNIGYVPQDPFLFQGTAKDNITAAAPFMDDAAVVRAAGLAGINEFLEQHPLGYDIQVGERGDGMSGGQRQGLTIARALLRTPNILILDEPTSSMDSRSENELRAKLASYAAHRSLVLVTHRTSMLGFVDRIVVLDNGQVVADGTREAVLEALRSGRVVGTQPGGSG